MISASITIFKGISILLTDISRIEQKMILMILSEGHDVAGNNYY